MRTQNNWFGPKRFGIGVSPANWRGWVTVGVYVVLLTASLRWLPAHSAYRPLGVIGLTVALFIVTASKYGPRAD